MGRQPRSALAGLTAEGHSAARACPNTTPESSCRTETSGLEDVSLWTTSSSPLSDVRRGDNRHGTPSDVGERLPVSSKNTERPAQCANESPYASSAKSSHVLKMRRHSPDSGQLQFRADYIAGLQETELPESLDDTAQGLEAGNRKTGQSGNLYRRMFVWNLPSVATCPGASSWCLRYCYNADPRTEVFPLGKWQHNWAWVERRPKELAAVADGPSDQYRVAVA